MSRHEKLQDDLASLQSDLEDVKRDLEELQREAHALLESECYECEARVEEEESFSAYLRELAERSGITVHPTDTDRDVIEKFAVRLAPGSVPWRGAA